MARRQAPRAAFAAGARAFVQSLPAMATWGVVTGIAMTKLGLGLATMLGLTFVVYSAVLSRHLGRVPLALVARWTRHVLRGLAGRRGGLTLNPAVDRWPPRQSHNGAHGTGERAAVGGVKGGAGAL